VKFRKNLAVNFAHKLVVTVALSFGALCGASAEEPSGKAAYDANCAACHTHGVAGAPQIGDQEMWQELIGKGIENLEDSAVNGIQGYGGNMPPRNGNPDLSDDEVKAAVAYMVEQSQ